MTIIIAIDSASGNSSPLVRDKHRLSFADAIDLRNPEIGTSGRPTPQGVRPPWSLPRSAVERRKQSVITELLRPPAAVCNEAMSQRRTHK